MDDEIFDRLLKAEFAAEEVRSRWRNGVGCDYDDIWGNQAGCGHRR